MYGFQTWNAHAGDEAAARRETANLAKSLAQQASDTFGGADATLQDLQFWAERGGLGPANRRALSDLMKKLVATTPQVHAVFLTDASGRRLLTTNPRILPNVTSRGRRYFQFHATHAARGSYIGEPLVTKSDKTLIVTISRRLDGPDGAFAGVVSASIALRYFENVYAGVDVGTDGTITLLRNDGLVIVRKPFDGRYLGRRGVREPNFYAFVEQALLRTYTARSRFDGVERIATYRRIDKFPLVIIVAVPEAVIFATWRTNSIIGLVAVCIVILTIVALARYLISEIREREAAQAKLARFAFIDGLTGLANRRFFDDALDREWRRAIRDRASMALLMVDVDRFKTFNDTNGHLGGDDVLRSIGACIASSVERPTDVGARFGGDEFAVLLPATPLEGALSVARRIQLDLAARRIAHAENVSGFATVSIGVASVTPGGVEDALALLREADAALYAAKRDGRNRVATAPPGFAKSH